MSAIRLLFFLLLVNSVLAQNYYPSGEAYRNVKDFNDKKPFVLSDFSFENYHLSSNFYKIKCIDSKIFSKIKGMQTWGILQDNILFLNAERLGMGGGYVKVLEFGKCCYFIGEPIRTRAQYDKASNNTLMFGLIGGLVTEAVIYEQNKNNIHYVINLDGSGNPHLLNQYYTEYILQDYPDLLPQFKSEPNPDDLETQLKYIRLVNKNSAR